MGEEQEKIILSKVLEDLRTAVTNAAVYMEGINRGDINAVLPAYRYILENAAILESLSKELNSLKENYSERIIPDILESMNMTEATVLGRVYSLKTALYASISKDKKEAGFKWLRDNGMEGLIQEAVHPKSLSSALDSFMQETAKCPPEDAVSIYIKKSIGVRKKR